MSICPHCKSTFWELETEEPRNSAFKVNFIRCASCKAPIGTMEYFSIHSKLEKMEKDMTKFEHSITNQLQVIDENVRRLFRK